MGIKQETNRLQDLQTFLSSRLFKNLVASIQQAISLSVSCIKRSLLRLLLSFPVDARLR